MSKSLKLIFFSTLLFILLILPVMALSEFGRGGPLERAEPLIEVINLIIALIAVGIALGAVSLLSGDLRKNWIYLIIAIATFAVFELFQVMKELKLFEFHGLSDLIEFIFIVFLLVAVYNLKNLFTKIAIKRIK